MVLDRPSQEEFRIRRRSILFRDMIGISFQRTLRIPDDGRQYPLPPSFGEFALRRVANHRDRVPESWRKSGGVFIGMSQREAMWILFECEYRRPCAVKIGVGNINAVTGELWTPNLTAEPQDYLVTPFQPWLDGINAGNGFIRQFVAMPLGSGYTVEGQLTGEEKHGGLQITVLPIKLARLPEMLERMQKGDLDLALDPEPMSGCVVDYHYCCPSASPMGLAPGGRMKQKIYPDPLGIDWWDTSSPLQVDVQIANSALYRQITGGQPLECPIGPRQYSESGLPWFDLYDECLGDLPASKKLAGVRSVKELDDVKGLPPRRDDRPVEILARQVLKLGADPGNAQSLRTHEHEPEVK